MIWAKVAAVQILALLASCAVIEQRPPLNFDENIRQRQLAQRQAEIAAKAQAEAKAEEDAKSAAYFQQLELSRAALDSCGTDYVLKHRDAPLTATELGEAAMSECAPLIDEIRSSTAQWLQEIHVNLSDRRELENRAVSTSVARAKGACLRALAGAK